MFAPRSHQREQFLDQPALLLQGKVGPVGGPPPGVFSGLQCPHCAIRKVRGAFPVGTAN